MSKSKGALISNETKELLLRYCRAAKNLYGMIPLSVFLKIYNSQNEPIEDDTFIEFLDGIDYTNEHFNIIGDDEVYEDVDHTPPMNRNLVAEYLYIFEDFDDYCELQEAQMGISYYVPKKEQFLKYEDEYYFEKTLEFISLRAFLRNQSNLSKERADEIAEEIQGVFYFDHREIRDAIAEAERLGFKANNPNEFEEFVKLVVELSKTARTHKNCGHTLEELYEWSYTIN